MANNNKKQITKITRGFQITLPLNIRTKMDVNIGNYIVFKTENNKVIIEKLKM